MNSGLHGYLRRREGKYELFFIAASNLVYLFLFVWVRVSQCSSSCYGTHYVDQTNLKFAEISLSLPPACWYERLIPQYSANVCYNLDYIIEIKLISENWRESKMLMFWDILHNLCIYILIFNTVSLLLERCIKSRELWTCVFHLKVHRGLYFLYVAELKTYSMSYVYH